MSKRQSWLLNSTKNSMNIFRLLKWPTSETANSKAHSPSLLRSSLAKSFLTLVSTVSRTIYRLWMLMSSKKKYKTHNTRSLYQSMLPNLLSWVERLRTVIKRKRFRVKTQVHRTGSISSKFKKKLSTAFTSSI